MCFNEKNIKLPVKDETPIQASYLPDIDILSELKSKDGSYYQLIIGILIWVVEIGRIDIFLEVYMVLSYLVLLW